MFIDIAIILIGFGALVWSADLFVDGAAAIARHLGMAPLLIGMTIVSVGTSAPEILVSLMSAISDAGALAIGNAFGSNIANIGLVLGVTLVIAPITVGKSSAFVDLPLLLLTSLCCGLLLIDGRLSFIDSSLLLAGLVLFFWRLLNHAHHPDINDEVPDIPNMAPARAWLLFGVGLIALVISSRALVYGAVNVATALGVSELIIGLTIVALGTSLPELAASLISAIRGHADIAIGAVVGSNMFNLLVVLALPGFFDDLIVERSDIIRDAGTVFVTTATLMFFVAINWRPEQQRARVGRFAGSTFLGIYIAYYVWLFI
jgi:cation:H+ antiporter